jgi:hypothetical protein
LTDNKRHFDFSLFFFPFYTEKRQGAALMLKANRSLHFFKHGTTQEQLA